MSTPERINHNPALIPPLGPAGKPQPAGPSRTPDGKTFDEILRTKVSTNLGTGGQESVAPDQGTTGSFQPSVKWSAHAVARLKQRGITLDTGQLQRLENAVNKVAAKGGKESLVTLDGIHMVVSVTNRTVITAVAQEQAKENVFTNIDSAAVA
jgi:flagellar operon protein